ncbi:GNAT family N-acetyltransferase [Neisseria sp. CCUG17229]|uniref:bifunctional acetate--CoA ligase family protein/GNAT family N-acetyltransferase n=1 Tax=Neisseria sp. CCUG17229 TaxID=3392036 RepID=UPI003A0FFDFB
MNTQPMPGYFFMPQHIILVGASERPHTLGERILTALLGSSFQGEITPVNLRHKTVAGLPAYPNLNKIDGQADLVIAVTPPDSYETLFKTCRKKQLHHLILIQDWESLSEEDWQTARQAIQKHHGQELNISVCSPAGIQLPTQGLNTGLLPDFPAGHVALLTGQAAVSSEIDAMLRRMQQGVSRHISLNYDLSPTSAADWINRFGHNRHTRIAVVQHNPAENQRKLFSAIRHFARHTPIIVHCTHAVDDTERAILESLSRHCNFLLTLNHNELAAALHARLSDIKPSNQLTALGNTPIGWLQPIAAEMGIQLTLPSEKTNLQNGYLGSIPTAAHYRSMAAQQLQQNHTQALLAVIAPSAEHNETAIGKMLNHLAKQTDKPLLVSSHVSDGLLHFPNPEQALQTLYLRNVAARLQQIQHEIAPAKSGRLKNIDGEAVAAAKDHAKNLAAALHLPAYQNGNTYPLVKLTFRRHPQYGAIISAADLNRTIAVLPPFTTLDTARLLRFADLNRYQDAIEQFVHSMNALVQNPELFNGEIILNISSNQISSDFRWPTQPAPASHKNSRPSEKTVEKPSLPTADGFNHRMQAAAEFLRYSNARASEFIRTTSEVAAEFWHQKNNTDKPKPAENVLAPYPADYPSEIKLKNGQTVSVRPFEPEDAEAKQQFIRRLSPQSRYTRFMTRTNALPQPTLARFSKLDYHSEGAWIAENSDGLIVAVSRFSRLTRDECEFGITLSEDMRSSGLAHEMMQLIIRLATQQGYQSMSAEILKENTAMLKLAEKSGFSLMESEQDKNLYQAKLNLLPTEEQSKEKFRQ